MMTIDDVSYKVIGAATKVHSALGPGLLEKVYDICLHDELTASRLQHIRQVRVPVAYQGRSLPSGFRIDFLVEHSVVVEIKAVDTIHPVHVAQLRSYLKIAGFTLGLVINFRVSHLRDGIRRVVNGYKPGTLV